jgi:hypothetical protein
MKDSIHNYANPQHRERLLDLSKFRARTIQRPPPTLPASPPIRAVGSESLTDTAVAEQKTKTKDASEG